MSRGAARKSQIEAEDDAVASHGGRRKRLNEGPDAEEAIERGGAGRVSGLFNLGLWSDVDMDEALYEAETEETPGESPFESGLKLGVSRSSHVSAQRQKPSTRPYRGRYVRAVPPEGRLVDLAWDATIRNAACYQRDRRRHGSTAIVLRKEDLLRKWRLHKPGRVILFLVDISGSMGGQNMELAKGVALRILEHAYVKRDRVAIIAFRDRAARLLVPPTDRAEMVNKTVSDLQCGGRTPLARGLELALSAIERATSGDPGVEPILIAITDGRGNVGTAPGYEDLQREIDHRAAALGVKQNLRILFLDTSEEGREDFAARRLTNRLKAERLLLWRLRNSGRDPAELALKVLG